MKVERQVATVSITVDFRFLVSEGQGLAGLSAR